MKDTFFTGDPAQFKEQIANYIDMFGITSEDLKNLSVAALLGQMMGLTNDESVLKNLQSMMGAATRTGVATQNASAVLEVVAKS